MTLSTFTGWKNLSLEDLVFAYRKAKADTFVNGIYANQASFALFEANLADNLQALLHRLQQGHWFEDPSLLGDISYVPKKLGLKALDDQEGHFYISEPDQAWQHTLSTHEITPEFRIIGDFPVDTHIISALWINTVGQKLDAHASEHAYGYRLKRIQANQDTLGEILNPEQTYEASPDDDLFNYPPEPGQPFHEASPGSFAHFFTPFKVWRRKGLHTLQKALNEGQKVAAISIDLQAFYHNIDPSCLGLPAFVNALGIRLTDEEMQFNREMAAFLRSWSDKAATQLNELAGQHSLAQAGLPLTLTCSHVIANTLMATWDREFVEAIQPLYYGRYVDDMFIVMPHHDSIVSSVTLLKYLAARLPTIKLSNPGQTSAWTIELGDNIQAQSHLCLQAHKQRLFVLQGQSGLDFVASIEHDIEDNEKGFQVMMDPEDFARARFSQLLTAAHGAGEHAESLRRAHGSLIRRTSWNAYLSHMRNLSTDLNPYEWEDELREFFDFTHRHIVRTDRLFEYYRAIPRLLSVAAKTQQYDELRKLIATIFASFDELRHANIKALKVNGITIPNVDRVWEQTISTAVWSLLIALLRSSAATKLLDLSQPVAQQWPLFHQFFAGWEAQSSLKPIVQSLRQDALLVLRLGISDLADEPYDKLMALEPYRQFALAQPQDIALIKAFANTKLIDVAMLWRFLKRTQTKRLGKSLPQQQSEWIYPYLFPTRPMRQHRIRELLGSKSVLEGSSYDWCHVVNCIRGTHLYPSQATKRYCTKEATTTTAHKIIGVEPLKKVRIALACMNTHPFYFPKVDGCTTPHPEQKDHYRDLYKELTDIVNCTIELDETPDYLVLPAFGVDHNWVERLNQTLVMRGTNIIGGSTYQQTGPEDYVKHNILALNHKRLGFTNTLVIRQDGGSGLLESYIAAFSNNGPQSDEDLEPKDTIFVHNGLHFAVLQSFDIFNTKLALSFQGQVDVLFCLGCWDMDQRWTNPQTIQDRIKTLAHELHAYVVYVGNRIQEGVYMYAPSMLQQGLVCAYKGGNTGMVITTEIDPAQLRTYQAQKAKESVGDTLLKSLLHSIKDKDSPSTSTKSQFVPLPEGFKLHPSRNP